MQPKIVLIIVDAKPPAKSLRGHLSSKALKASRAQRAGLDDGGAQDA